MPPTASATRSSTWAAQIMQEVITLERVCAVCSVLYGPAAQTGLPVGRAVPGGCVYFIFRKAPGRAGLRRVGCARPGRVLTLSRTQACIGARAPADGLLHPPGLIRLWVSGRPASGQTRTVKLEMSQPSRYLWRSFFVSLNSHQEAACCLPSCCHAKAIFSKCSTSMRSASSKPRVLFATGGQLR